MTWRDYNWDILPSSDNNYGGSTAKKEKSLTVLSRAQSSGARKGKQLIDCTTENKMRHDECAVFTLRSCQLFVLFSPVNESNSFNKPIELRMAEKLMSYSVNDDASAPLEH